MEVQCAAEGWTDGREAGVRCRTRQLSKPRHIVQHPVPEERTIVQYNIYIYMNHLCYSATVLFIHVHYVHDAVV